MHLLVPDASKSPGPWPWLSNKWWHLWVLYGPSAASAPGTELRASWCTQDSLPCLEPRSLVLLTPDITCSCHPRRASLLSWRVHRAWLLASGFLERLRRSVRATHLHNRTPNSPVCKQASSEP